MAWYQVFKDFIGFIGKYNPIALKRQIRKLEEKQQHFYDDEKKLCYIRNDRKSPNEGDTLVCKRCWEVDNIDIRLTRHTDKDTGEVSATCEQCHRRYILRDGQSPKKPPRLGHRTGR